MNKTVENVLNDVILMLILTVFILIGYMGKYCYFGMFKVIMLINICVPAEFIKLIALVLLNS